PRQLPAPHAAVLHPRRRGHLDPHRRRAARVQHRPGVKEDITEVILNIKNLVVSSENDEPVVMYLRREEAGRVTAADITPPAGVEIHNPDLHIATLNEKGRLEIELIVERGRGYVSAAQNKGVDGEIGRVPVDSIYSPVL